MQPVMPDWSLAPTPTRPKRGFILSTLVLMSMLSNISACITYVFAAAVATRVTIDGVVGERLHDQLLFLAAVSVANVAFLSGIWAFKKWGVYGYLGFSLVGAFAGLSVRPGPVLFSLAWAGAMVFLMAPRWRHFE